MRVILSGVVLCFGLGLHGCSGGDDPTPTPSPSPTSPPFVPPQPVVTLDEGGDVLMRENENATRVGPTNNFVFTEGPVWIPGMGWLFSDVVGDTQWQYSAGELSAWRTPSMKANGMVLDNDGSLLTCEHEGRRVQRQLPNDTSTPPVTVADMYMMKKLTSPNDVAVLSNGRIYFSDPSYGTDPNFGHGQMSEQTKNRVYRVESDGSGIASVIEDSMGFSQPNGIAFSLDETVAYVADTEEGHIRRFNVLPNGDFSSFPVADDSDIIVNMSGPDGVKVDEMGNLWTTTTNRVNAYSSTEKDKRLLTIYFGEDVQPSNMAFGGMDGKTLMITGASQVSGLQGFVWTIPTLVTSARSGQQAAKELVEVQV